MDDPLDIFAEKRTRLIEIMDESDDDIDTADVLRQTYKIDPICDNLGTKVKILEKLGEGGGGSVFNSEFNELTTKRLAVKQINFEMITTNVREYRKKFVSSFYGKDIDMTDEVTIPEFLTTNCTKSYTKLNTGETVKLDKNSIVCDSDETEFLLALFVGELYRKGISINFMRIYYYAICADYEKQNAQYYTFMQQIDTTFSSLLENPQTSIHLVNHIFIQVLHSIGMYQSYYRIVHDDLHAGNVFLVEAKDEVYNGKKLSEVDYYEYKIEGKSIFLEGPKTSESAKYIVKIGDWDQAVKYTIPITGDSSVFMNEYEHPKPNWYNRAYDILTIIFAINRKLKYIPGDFIGGLTAWLLKTKPDKESLRSEIYKMRGKDSTFPNIKRLGNFKNINPTSLFNHKLFEPYTVSPPAGSKILLIGDF